MGSSRISNEKINQPATYQPMTKLLQAFLINNLFGRTISKIFKINKSSLSSASAVAFLFTNISQVIANKRFLQWQRIRVMCV